MAIDFAKMAAAEESARFEQDPAVLVVSTIPFDLEEIKKPFKKYQMKVAEMKMEAEVLVVDSDESAQVATEMATQISAILKEMEVERKKVILEPDKFVRGINSFFRTFKTPLQSISGALKKKLGDYAYRQELERRKAEKAAQEEQARKQAELDKAAKKHNIDPVKMPTMVAPKKKAPVRSESGSSAVRYKWTFEVQDETKIPRKYLSPDPKKIQAAVDAGIRKIEGVEILEKPIVSIRGG